MEYIMTIISSSVETTNLYDWSLVNMYITNQPRLVRKTIKATSTQIHSDFMFIVKRLSKHPDVSSVERKPNGVLVVNYDCSKTSLSCNNTVYEP
jgi:hypothetical protein